MTNERVRQLIKEAYDKNLTILYLDGYNLAELPPEIGKLKNLKELDLSRNQLTQLPPEIGELKKLTELSLYDNQLAELPPGIGKLKNLIGINLSRNQLTQLPPEIGELNKLTKFYSFNSQLIRLPLEIGELKNLIELELSGNQLTQLPLEIGEFKNLIELELSGNQLTQLPPEIRELKNLIRLNLSYNNLAQLPEEIGELKKLEILNLSQNKLTQLPPKIGELSQLEILNLSQNKLTQLPLEIGKLKNLVRLDLYDNQLIKLPPEIGKLKNLVKLNSYGNRLTQLPPEIRELKNLIELELSGNQLTQLPLEIGELKNLIELELSGNQLTQLPPEIGELKNLIKLELSGNQLTQLPSEIIGLQKLRKLKLTFNPLTSPPPEIVSMGLEAIFTYFKQLKQSKTTEHNEAKLILVGNGEVGKTCLANRLITGKFVKEGITEGVNISEWITSAHDSGNSKIKLNIWDFGGQEIYHATHQFFLTTRSVYLLVWNARKIKDFGNIYYWLHTIEAFGGDSPIILVMSKMNESDDDLNLKDLKSKFPQIAYDLKVDSEDGKGISILKERISETAWNLPSMRAPWFDSWYKVREKLEGLREYWIPYDEFCKICVSEGLDKENINTLDGYLHKLGVTLHFNDRIGLKNVVILKPKWATGAFYKILSTKSVLQCEGILLHSELEQIWDKEIYPPEIQPQLMELMNKFELAYELPNKSSYLVAELLPKNAPDFMWDEKDELCFYYCYDYFLPPGIIPRFIVQMHQDIEKKENGMPLCWREGAVLKLQSSRALVKMNHDEKQIEIRIKDGNKRGTLEVICYYLDHINAAMKKIKVSKQIPCNCSENCPERFSYEILLKADMNNVEAIQCHESLKPVSVSLLLDGYKIREEKFREYGEISRQLGQTFVFSPNFVTSLESNQIMKAEQKTDVNTNVNVNLKIDLPQIQTDFDNLINEIKRLNPELDSSYLDKIQDGLDEVSPNSEQEKLIKPLNKLNRFLIKLSDPDSDYNKVITGTQKGIENAQKLGRTYNKFAQWLAMPQVPDLFLGK